MRRFLVYWAPLLAYAALILHVSIVEMPEELPPVPLIDKAFHFTSYSVMGALVARILRQVIGNRGAGGRIMALSGAAAFAAGLVIEVCQYFTEYRSAEALDAVANGAGGIFGAFVYLKAVRRGGERGNG